MLQQLQGVYTQKWFNEETGKMDSYRHTYHITIRNGKVENVFNTAMDGVWGHSVDKNSEIFQHFSKIHNKK